MKKILIVVLLLSGFLSACGGGGGTPELAPPQPQPQRTSVKLPQTGQVQSYDTNTVQGDDGALKMGVAWPSPRFSEASSGTGTVVTDNLTGLMWTGDGGTPTFTGTSTCTGGTKTWQDALNYVVCLNTNNYLGRNDWRLPNRKELWSLVNYGQASSAAWLNTQTFTNAQTGPYWSSTTDAGDTSASWAVYMVDGNMGNYNKTFDYYVWPVRSGQGAYAPADLPRTGQTNCYDAAGAVISCVITTGQGQDGALQKGVAWPSPRFMVASDGTGTVVDKLTGLIWPQAGSTPTFTGPTSTCNGGFMAWQDALNYVACLNTNSYLGHNDWRLPNVNELESLVHAEYKREMTCSGSCATNAAWLNTQGFSVQTAWYWSSTSYAPGAAAGAWLVNMNNGFVSNGNKSSGNYVWPVRAGQ